MTGVEAQVRRIFPDKSEEEIKAVLIFMDWADTKFFKPLFSSLGTPPHVALVCCMYETRRADLDTILANHQIRKEDDANPPPDEDHYYLQGE